jgi:hypothetical protein
MLADDRRPRHTAWPRAGGRPVAQCAIRYSVPEPALASDPMRSRNVPLTATPHIAIPVRNPVDTSAHAPAHAPAHATTEAHAHADTLSGVAC